MPRSSFAALKLKNGSVLVTGGLTTGNKAVSDCEIIGIGGKIASMGVKRSAHSMCQVGDYVYAFGGMDDKNELLASVERIKLTESQQFPAKWEYVCEMPVACSNIGLVPTAFGQIVTLGGKTLT